MTWLINRLRIPANESNMGIVLAACAVTLGLMSVALVWQAQIIAQQRQAIQWLEHLKFGG
jgi:putative Mn2+ efflux pump MntP